MNEQTKKEVRAGVLQGAGVAAVVLLVSALALPFLRSDPPAVSMPPAVVASESPVQSPPAAHAARLDETRAADFGDVRAPADVALVAGWAVATDDRRGAPFAVIDKRRTHLYVFDEQGRLKGDSPLLLGYAAGDDSVPGIGQRPIHLVRPGERTTPAGRFDAAAGRNLSHEDVIWVDYDAAVSMHRVRATDPRERRLQRLATPTTADNRISYGCINVPVAFFDAVVWPTLGTRRGVVYVLPEVKPLEQVFPAAAAWHPSRAPAEIS